MPLEADSSSLLSSVADRWLEGSTNAQSWSVLYTLEITSDECLSRLRLLISCPSAIAAARSFQGSEAGALINFLDRVSKSCTWQLSNLIHWTQVLKQSYLNDKLRQRCLRLLCKTCKTQALIPVSYVIRQELVRVGHARYCGGYAEVSDGDYLGLPVAIKRLKTNKGDFDKMFKVCSIKRWVL